MNTQIFYLTSSVWSICGLWVLWQFGVKKLLLDNFRDDLFQLRDSLYAMSQAGQIRCDSEAYRAVEHLLNAMIRYAHRFTMASLFLSFLEGERLRKAGDPENFAAEFARKIASVKDPIVSAELGRIIARVNYLLPRYAGKSSFFFALASFSYIIFRKLQPVIALKHKREVVAQFERQAYLAAKSDKWVYA